MMNTKTHLTKSLVILAILAGIMACNDDTIGEYGQASGLKRPIMLSGEIEQVAVTRVNDNGFCNGDEIGVYIVDYNGSNPGTLLNSGNRGNNVKHTFDETANQWESAYDIYWKDNNTHIDVYGYYPYGAPENVNAYPFQVQKDQASTTGEMGGYEASDFLWGKAGDVAPTERVILIPMRHRMSSPRITLVEGDGFTSGEWASLQKSVLVRNTKQNALIDLATGNVTATGEVATTGIIPYEKDNVFRAIVVPQTISAGTILFTITVDGTTYDFSRKEAFAYVSGKMHNFTIEVNKRTETGDYTFNLAGESITAWENDDVSHDATLKEYVVIESTAGKLKEAITAAGKDYTQIENLKVTGEIDANDFVTMNRLMTNLRAINLKETTIKAGEAEFETDGMLDHLESKENEFPSRAFSNNLKLTSLILPDNITKIGAWACNQCHNWSGSLTIPEGVIEIGDAAFAGCEALTGTLTLPSGLTKIAGSTFSGCGFTCELKLGDNIEFIGLGAFNGCKNLYGSLHLPSKLKILEALAFSNCPNLTGDLNIPEGVTEIGAQCFEYSGFNGTLTLHDNITYIGEMAFQNVPIRGSLVLPKKLTTVARLTFSYCDLTEVVFPEGLIAIGDNAFANNWRLMGTLEFPEGFLSIGNNAFAECSSIEGLTLPQSLESIASTAFRKCI